MLRTLEGGLSRDRRGETQDKLACLTALERKVLWLSTWMIHNANHVRPNRDGLKVGGHQASSASRLCRPIRYMRAWNTGAA